MKKLLLIFVGLFMLTFLKAQTPLSEAVDFSVKDVHGIQHHLFDILDNDEKYVLVDFFSPT